MDDRELFDCPGELEQVLPELAAAYERAGVRAWTMSVPHDEQPPGHEDGPLAGEAGDHEREHTDGHDQHDGRMSAVAFSAADGAARGAACLGIRFSSERRRREAQDFRCGAKPPDISPSCITCETTTEADHTDHD